jgi:hypothetical protein
MDCVLCCLGYGHGAVTVEAVSGRIGRYLRELLKKVFSINLLNFDLGVVLWKLFTSRAMHHLIFSSIPLLQY